MLDSDLPMADERLTVEFFVDNRPGKSTGKTYIKIQVPGDVLNIIERPMRDADKARFPRQWLAYQMKNNEMPIHGYLLEDWAKDVPDSITHGQIQQLHVLGFRVVEQLAAASDRHLQQIGMGAEGLRNRAQKVIKARNSSEHDREMADLKDQIAKLTAMVASVPARGPGRPKKDEQAAA